MHPATDPTALRLIPVTNSVLRDYRSLNALLPFDVRRRAELVSTVIRSEFFKWSGACYSHCLDTELAKHFYDLDETQGAILRLYVLVDAVKSTNSQAVGTAAGQNSQDSLTLATQQLQREQMSFNLQYLQLQNQMQNENRSYTAVSNIMKTKHDTVKNSISNIR